jgi:hypothetical protein
MHLKGSLKSATQVTKQIRLSDIDTELILFNLEATIYMWKKFHKCRWTALSVQVSSHILFDITRLN